MPAVRGGNAVTTKDTHPKLKVEPQTDAPNEASESFHVHLKTVDLERYYPQKLTSIDALCIRKETLGSMQHTEQPELLPYYMIMMHNYKSRTNM